MSALAISDPEDLAPTEGISVAAASILRSLREHPITAVAEAILRVIASMFYREGCCWAAQRTIAEAIGRGKSTVARELDELECRGLIRRIVRAHTSHVIQLADGLIEALRAMRLERCTARLRMRGVRALAPSFRNAKMPSTLESTPLVALPPADAESSAAMRTTPVLRGRYESSEGVPVSVIDSSEVVHTTCGPKAPTEPRLPRSSVIFSDSPEKSSSRARANENDVAIKVATEKLVAEGVTPKRAQALAKLFELDQIQRNISLGLHRDKNNPPGYLVTAIQHDYAARTISPHSEAAKVRESQRSRATSVPVDHVEIPAKPSQIRPTDTAAKTAPTPKPVTILSEEDRAHYEARAREEVLRRLPSGVDTQGPVFRAMVRARMQLACQEKPGRSP